MKSRVGLPLNTGPVGPTRPGDDQAQRRRKPRAGRVSEGAAGPAGRTRRRPSVGTLRTRCVVVQVKPIKQVKPAFSEHPTTEQNRVCGRHWTAAGCRPAVSAPGHSAKRGCLCHRAVLRIHCVRTHKGAQQASVLTDSTPQVSAETGVTAQCRESAHMARGGSGAQCVRGGCAHLEVFSIKSSSSGRMARPEFRPARSSGLRLGKNKKQHTQCLPVYSWKSNKIIKPGFDQFW